MPDGDRQPPQRHEIGRHAVVVHHHEGHQRRDDQRRTHHQAGAQVTQENEHYHE